MTSTTSPPTAIERTTFFSVCAATLVVMGLVAAVNIAVPQLASSSLHPDSSALLWIVDAYVVVFACLVIPAGAMGDRFGRKGMLLSGLAVVAAGCLVCAVAPNVAVLLGARVVTGIGAALVLPNCVGVIVHSTPPERRARALGAWGAVSGAGGLVGNTFGAAIVQVGTWRSLFAVVAALAAIGAIAVAVAAPRTPRVERALDPVGTGLLVAATVALLAGIIEGPSAGWWSPTVIGAFLAGAILAVAWVLVELRLRNPLLDPRLFRIPQLSTAALGMAVTFFGSFGLFYLNASLLQYGRGFSPLEAGLGILPLAVPLLIVSRLVPGLVRRAGIRWVIAAAFAAIGVGLLGLSLSAREPYLVYALWLVLVGVGFALALPSLTAELTLALPPERAGIAGGLQAATRELGSALGVAVVGTVLTAVFADRLPAELQRLTPRPRTVADAFAATLGHHPAILSAFVDGAVAGLRVAGIVTLLAGILVVIGSPRRARP